MSVTARLHLGEHRLEEKGIRILTCNYSFSQEVNELGCPKSVIRPGFIELSIPGINDAEIVRWMISRNVRKKGKISFLGVNEGGVQQETKKLEFEDAILVNYRETFTDQTDMVIYLTISARKIRISDETFESQWDIMGNE